MFPWMSFLTLDTFRPRKCEDVCHLLYLLIPFYPTSAFRNPEHSLFPSSLTLYALLLITSSHPTRHHIILYHLPFLIPPYIISHANFYRINPGQSPSGHCSELRHCCGWSSYPIRLSRQWTRYHVWRFVHAGTSLHSFLFLFPLTFFSSLVNILYDFRDSTYAFIMINITPLLMLFDFIASPKSHTNPIQ